MGAQKNTERQRLVDRAKGAIEKRRLDKAIEELTRLAALAPLDARMRMRLGDLYQKTGGKRRAAELYCEAASLYEEGGFLAKASALLKQALALDPDAVEAELSLARLYDRSQMGAQALPRYASVLKSLEQKGQQARLLPIAKDMVQRDQHNAKRRLLLAKLLLRQPGREQEAALELEAGARLFDQQGRPSEGALLRARALKLDPARMDLALSLARHYFTQKEHTLSLAMLQRCYKANPRDAAALALLQELFESIGQRDKAQRVAKELTQAGRPREPAQSPAETAGAAYVEQLLAEADVYAKYGLDDKALARLAQAVALEPDHGDAVKMWRALSEKSSSAA